MIQVQGDIESGFPERSPMVDPQSVTVEWEGHHLLPSRSDHTVRCFSPRLGSSLQWDKDWRSLDSSLHINALELLGGQVWRGTAMLLSICSKIWIFFLCLAKVLIAKDPPVAMVPTEGNPPVYRTPSRGCEHNSRPGIQADRSFNRMEVAQGSIPLDSADPEPLPDGPVCNQVKPSIRQLHQLETRSLCSGIPAELEGARQLHVPSLLPDREMLTEDPTRTEHHHHGSTPVALAGVLSNPDGVSSRLPPKPPKTYGPATEPIQSASPQ